MMQQIIEEAESALLHTYNRYQVVFDHGNGVKLYDIEGKEFPESVCLHSVTEIRHIMMRSKTRLTRLHILRIIITISPQSKRRKR